MIQILTTKLIPIKGIAGQLLIKNDQFLIKIYQFDLFFIQTSNKITLISIKRLKKSIEISKNGQFISKKSIFIKNLINIDFFDLF